MKVHIVDIAGPCEPGVYAVARVEVSFGNQNSLTIDRLLVVGVKPCGELAVRIPCTVVDENDAVYGNQPSYTVSPSLRRLVARAVFDAFDAWVKSQAGAYRESQWVPLSESDEWCIPASQCA